MSHSCYPDYQRQSYSDSPINHNIQSQTSVHEYQNQYCDNNAMPSAQPVDNSSTLAQTYSPSVMNHATDNTTNACLSSDPVSNYTLVHHPDSVSPIQHRYVDTVPETGVIQRWAGSVRDTEVISVQPGDIHDQRWGSCASMDTNDTWYSHDNANDENYDYTQPAVAEQNHHVEYYQQQPELQEAGVFGMYSPTQHSRIQELDRNAPYDSDQWAPAPPSPGGNLQTPYGTLPNCEHQAQCQRPLSDAYHGFDNGSTSHPHLTSTSPVIQLHHLSTESRQQPVSPPAASSGNKPEDLYYQQRQAANYQHGLQVQQELKYHLSGQLKEFEATHRGQENCTVDQHYTYTPTHDTHHLHNPAQHQHHTSLSSDHRLPSPPIVPSQARERIAPCAQSSPEAEEKKGSPPKKPALACLFCRKRKIACGPPPPDSPDHACNQCSRRKQPCEYPTESRRGVRKTPKGPSTEKPAAPNHRFVNGDGPSRELTGAIRSNSRGRRK